MSDFKSKTLINSIKDSIIFRILLIGILILLLLIPSAMIKALIDEREHRKDSVINEICSKWALEQTITGPVIDLPYKTVVESLITDQNGKEKKVLREEIRFAHFLPNKLQIRGSIIPEIRKRGIYRAVVYTADLIIDGNFLFPDFKRLNLDEKDILWNKALLSFGINDMRGINRNIEAKWNDNNVILEPGLKNNDIIDQGVNSKIDFKTNNTFSIKINIRGSSVINFIPLGKETIVKLNSAWDSPSFSGAFLPKERNIDKKGFYAKWEIFDYNRTFPQQWIDKERNVNGFKFGVELFTPVGEYQKAIRSVKYASLFIFLTFLAFFLLIEILNKKRIHPIQYLLVGFALCLFYILLISISEHLNFNIAYLISSICIIGLTSIYTKSISGKINITILMSIMLVCFFSFLFIILQLEDYSLLAGSIGLFIILTIIMIGTRKIDWYSLKLEKKEK